MSPQRRAALLAAMAPTVQAMRHQARKRLYDGRPENAGWVTRCRVTEQKLGTVLIYTRDQGHHSSGWWKNPAYEYCWHLSLSFFDPERPAAGPRDFDWPLARLWAGAFFGPGLRYAWTEPPWSWYARRAGVHHWRIFTDPTFTLLILPQGEVYSTANTPLGWRSHSEVVARGQATAPPPRRWGGYDGT